MSGPEGDDDVVSHLDGSRHSVAFDVAFAAHHEPVFTALTMALEAYAATGLNVQALDVIALTVGERFEPSPGTLFARPGARRQAAIRSLLDQG